MAITRYARESCAGRSATGSEVWWRSVLGQADKPCFSLSLFPSLLWLLRSPVMTNNPSARVAGTMETIQWYEKAGLHCRTNHRQGSSFSLLCAPHPFSTPSVYICRGTPIVLFVLPSRSPFSLCAIQYRTAPRAFRISVSARVNIPDLTFSFIHLSLSLFKRRKESYTAE